MTRHLLTRAAFVCLSSCILWSCERPQCGEIGEPCPQICSEGEGAICVTKTICACVSGGSGGEEGGERAGATAGAGAGSSAGMNSSGEIAGTSGPAECSPPELGELVINEAMIDAEGDENTYEFVELVNLADRPVDLSGVQIIYNGAEKVSFVSGCMEARSIGALYAAEEEWSWSSPPGGVTAVKKAFRFSNSGDFTFVLLSAEGVEMSVLSGTNDLVSEGVSVNRDPDFNGSSVIVHSEGSTRPSSPGLCIGGGRLEEGCPVMDPGGSEAGAMAGESAGGVMAGMIGGASAGALGGDVAGVDAGETPPPACDSLIPGELIINEVMISPEGDDRVGEFIEIVNLSAEARSLAGVSLSYNGAEKVLFSAGCMAPQSVGALYGDESRWIWSAPVDGLAYEKSAFRLTNSSDFSLALTLEGVELDSFSGTSDLISEGVSVNRAPDLDPTSSSVALHHDLNSDLDESPGRCANGGEVAEGCALPEVDMGVADMDLSDMGVTDMDPSDMNMGDMNMGDMNLGDMNLSDMNLSDMNLSDMNLSDMNLSDMNLSDMNLSDMNLSDMNLSDMNLSDMNLSDMNMSDMNMSDMNLSDMNLSDMNLSDMNMSDMGPIVCVQPNIGGLVINEALANPEGNESVDDSEWIEIINATDQPISLEGVELWSEGAREITFAALCLPAHAALTLYNLKDPSGWVWSTPAIGDLAAQATQTFTLTNSRPINLAMRLGEVELNRFDAETRLIVSGISANRNPDADPNAVVSLHSDVPGSLERTSSPGLCANGARFEDLCQP